MRNLILGLILGILLVPAVVYLYLWSGRAPVATAEPMMPFEKRLADVAMHAKLRKEQPQIVPLQPDETTYLAGVRVYRKDCAMCHGLPNQPPPEVIKGMFPKCPQLLPPHKGVTDDPAGKTFWKVKNGIRLSGMPSFRDSFSDEQLWQVSLLLANADKLSDSVNQALAAPPPK
jgi:thiosulfate dehydrogenase